LPSRPVSMKDMLTVLEVRGKRKSKHEDI